VQVNRGAAVRLTLSLVVCAFIIIGAGEFFGARGWAADAAIALLWLAWRHDNEVGVLSGACYLLFLIVPAVMCLLIYLMLLTHSR
jgi:hypothetical protein